MGIKPNMGLLIYYYLLLAENSQNTQKNKTLTSLLLFFFPQQSAPAAPPPLLLISFSYSSARVALPLLLSPARRSLSLYAFRSQSLSPSLSSVANVALPLSLSLFRQCHIQYRQYVQHCILLAFVDTHEILREHGDFEASICILILYV